ncbi:nitrilase-related carbon-nitrogen hydrolase [Desulfurococcus mucosus]|uniref:Amidohydrolase-like protein n=1 Tax=Desulfurococcus mucosus (strain ATCC 35584 / DSM 2162 / JCM 9187 / O7/1) TaxID=765177 RepID=E8R9K4_DESM0|nr:nitrilase-related carbon-nitrogen hydrolase [Desulfurococcus mucosus]ADV65180.1 amidohydrolase-like protein [Desulfurococcus mucosus DSM 2162]
MSTEGFKLVELGKGVPGSRLGIAHMPVVTDAFGINLNHLRRIVFYASERNVNTLIIPYSAAFGPVIEAYSDIMEAEELRRRYAVDSEHQYLKTLRYLSANYGLNIISPALIERAGSRYYISSVFVPYGNGEEPVSQRKILVSSEEKKIGIRPGHEISVLNDYYLKYVVLVSNEIVVPELGRVGVAQGCNMVVSTISPLKPVRNYVDIVRALAQILGVWVLHVGGIFIVNDDRYVLNSLVVNPQGELVVMYSEATPGLVTVPYRDILAAEHVDHGVDAAGILGFLLRYVRKRRKAGKLF